MDRVAPMLAKLASELPVGDYLYEPKWDGFRCLAFRDGDEVDLRSRHGKPLARYFPEVVEGVLALGERRIALDGELVASDFPALMARLHPAASRVERLRRETPACLVVFDLPLVDAPFAERRERLEALELAPPLMLTPLTDDVEVARAWLESQEGVIAKPRGLRYEPGVRAMTKVKRTRTADCVVAGFRFLASRPAVSSLLLGLHDREGRLEHVGVAGGFTERQRRELLETVAPLVTPLPGHPWEHGFLLEGGATGRFKGSAGRWAPGMEMDWVPVRPELVAEVRYDTLDGLRFRHPARFERWRPDRDPRSCTFEQLEQ